MHFSKSVGCSCIMDVYFEFTAGWRICLWFVSVCFHPILHTHGCHKKVYFDGQPNLIYLFICVSIEYFMEVYRKVKLFQPVTAYMYSKSAHYWPIFKNVVGFGFSNTWCHLWVHRQKVPRQNVPRDETSQGTKRSKT